MIILPSTVIDDMTVPPMHLFVGEQAALLLNSRTGTSILISHEIAEKLKTGAYPQLLLSKMLSRGMLNEATDTSPVKEDMPSFFLIDMTQNCNYACSYCLRDPNTTGRRISFEMLRNILNKIIDYCRTNNVTRITIQPWGGEPLMELDKILYIRKMMTEEAPDILTAISIETNGSLLTDSVVQQLSMADIRIGISIDGPEVIHDHQRKDQTGRPTFKRTLQGLQTLSKSSASVGTITVVTKDSLPRIPEILDFFAECLPQVSVKLNPMQSPGKTDSLPQEITPEDMPDMMRQIVEKIISFWKQGKKLSEGNITTALRNIMSRDDSDICHSRGCRGGREMIIFDSEGRYFPCEMVNWPGEQIGSVEDDTDILVNLKHAIRKNEYFKRKHKEECNDCPWWYYCRGGCTSSLMYKKGCCAGVDELGCARAEAVYDQVVKLITDAPALAAEIAGIRQISMK